MIDQLDDAIRDALADMVAEAPALGPTPSARPRQGRSRRVIVPSALAAAAAIGAILVIVTRGHSSVVRTTDTTIVSSDETAGYVPSWLPDGVTVPTGSWVSRPLFAGNNTMQVFGFNGTDPGELVAVDVSSSNGTGFCGGAPDGLPEPVDVNGECGIISHSERGGLLQWTVGAHVAHAFAGRAISDDELLALARSLTLVPRRASTVETHMIPRTDNLPQGWSLVVDRDALVLAGATEAMYTLTPPAGVAEPSYTVTMWTGVSDAGLWAIDSPVDDETVTVRGHTGLLDESDERDPLLSWVEGPGTVILVQNSGGDRRSILDFAESLEPVDNERLTTFLGLDRAPDAPATTVAGSDITPRRGFWFDVNLPDRFGYTPEQSYVLDHTYAVLTQRCLDRRGLDIDIYDPPAPTGSRNYPESRFAFDDRDLVAREAYSWMAPSGDGGSDVVPDTALDQYADAITACRADADQKLSGEGRTNDDELVTAQNELVRAFAADPDSRRIAGAWASCMADAGYPNADLFGQQLPDLSVVNADTIARALADFDCRTSTGYRDAKIDWYTEHVRAWIDEHAGLIELIQAQHDAAIRRANALLGAG